MDGQLLKRHPHLGARHGILALSTLNVNCGCVDRHEYYL